MKNKNLIIWIIILLVIVTTFYVIKNSNKIGPLGSTHEHASFIVYINGESLNFAHPQYMVTDKFVHIENMDGKEIHKHATGVTLGYFFKTLGFKFNNECFILDDKTKYCNDKEKKLNFYVNGVQNYNYEKYEITEGDKYLISYGDNSNEEIQKQINFMEGDDNEK